MCACIDSQEYLGVISTFIKSLEEILNPQPEDLSAAAVESWFKNSRLLPEKLSGPGSGSPSVS